MYSMTILSPKRSAILSFIRERIGDRGQPPSLAEISEAFGFASRSVARKHIVALTEAGFIAVTANQARGIRLVEHGSKPQLLEIPLLGRVAAGMPIDPDVGVRDHLVFDSRMFARVPDFLLQVEGDSMIGDGILDGDLVGVKRQFDARNGQIVVARLNGEVTIKRFELKGEHLRLLPRNPAYEPIVVDPEQEFMIEGIFCGLVRR
ncbi:MAG: transcriptional repressor LexA [Pseudomonas sp.]|uniref:transcriptional repressor LexA n=1 Tax=Pseudomonas abieticivorans TaxID=2931382 RepID=UPI0020BEC366|nr:transcriptional repressor LexA [Pseudomonas sp. PIA16]MDE1167356.1 transcriptional repressor LexA [Pseudomonas sp.]